MIGTLVRMTLDEIKALAKQWADIVRSEPDGTVDLAIPKPGWPTLPPVGKDRVEVVGWIITLLGPDYSINGATATGARLLVLKNQKRSN
jgi:hypothetical protein